MNLTGAFDAQFGPTRGQSAAVEAQRAQQRDAAIDKLALAQRGASENLGILPGGFFARLLAKHQYDNSR